MRYVAVWITPLWGMGCEPPPIELGPEPSGGSGETGVEDSPRPMGPIADLLQRQCVSCHRQGELATWVPLATYPDVLDHRFAITFKFEDSLSEPRMPIFTGGKTPTCQPPLPYANDPAVTQDEVSRLLAWLDADLPLSGWGPKDMVLTAPPVAPLSPATAYPFDEGFVVWIEGDPLAERTNMVDRLACVVVDPNLAESGWMSGFGVQVDWEHLFKGVELRIDPDRESLAFIAPSGTGPRGERWYGCEDGFGFDGPLVGTIQAGSGPSADGAGDVSVVPPFGFPAGSAIEVPAGSLLVYRIRYHIHQANLDPTDETPVPYHLEYTDHTSLAVRWEEPFAVQTVVQLVRLGGAKVGAGLGTGLATAPFEIPPDQTGDTDVDQHSEILVGMVPGAPTDTYQVFSVQPVMRTFGAAAELAIVRDDGEECLGAVPKFQESFQTPLRYSEVGGAPIVHGGDRLRGTCVYENPTVAPVTLGLGPGEELCEFTLGLAPVAARSAGTLVTR